MTKNEIKAGDRVRIEIPGIIDIGVVISKDTYGYNVKCGENYHYGVCAEYLKPTSLDRKTAFLTELQALLRKYDARIYDGELYAIHIEIGYHSAKSEQADYLFYQSGNNEINADNIMDFDKE